MSDPQRTPGATPPRAEPLQPDRPGSGPGTERKDGPPMSRKAQQELEEQERTAHENTREGYDG